MSDLILVYCPFGDEEEAARIARTVVGERLAACANLLGPIRSIYRWRGELADESEVAVLFKTSAARSGALIDRLGVLHSYDVPAISAIRVSDAPQDFVAWIETETKA